MIFLKLMLGAHMGNRSSKTRKKKKKEEKIFDWLKIYKSE